MPAINLTAPRCNAHLQRTFALYQNKAEQAVSWETYLDHLYPLDWFLASACLEGIRQAWEQLFASRAGRSDCLLMDALHARAPGCIRAMRSGKTRPSPILGPSVHFGDARLGAGAGTL